MTPSLDEYNVYEFTQEEKEVLRQYLSSPTMREYLGSTFAQFRNEYLEQAGSPFAPSSVDHKAILAFIAGAEDYLSQILRIGES